MLINQESQLRKIYGYPKDRAKNKVLKNIDKHAKYFISCSPFIVISTTNKLGQMDASPRGGEPGFVHVTSDTEILIPDFKGNNRIDSLSNIIETGQIGLLFLIPGIDETLRVNGKATISTDPIYLDNFRQVSKPPITVIKVDIQELFLHCAKAFMRSKLWKPESHLDPKIFPSIGEMLKDQLQAKEPAESREAMIKRYQKDI